VSILENKPPGEGISADVILGKNMKRGREKGGMYKKVEEEEER
jgi:hypothetical protein